MGHQGSSGQTAKVVLGKTAHGTAGRPRHVGSQAGRSPEAPLLSVTPSNRARSEWPRVESGAGQLKRWIPMPAGPLPDETTVHCQINSRKPTRRCRRDSCQDHRRKTSTVSHAAGEPPDAPLSSGSGRKQPVPNADVGSSGRARSHVGVRLDGDARPGRGGAFDEKLGHLGR